MSGRLNEADFNQFRLYIQLRNEIYNPAISETGNSKSRSPRNRKKLKDI